MTRLSVAVAATLAAALCLLIGVVIGRDAKPLDRDRLTRAMYARLPYTNWTADADGIVERLAAEYDRLASGSREVRDQGYVESHGWFV